MSQRKDIKKVLIIGSGPIIIGQACEFDYSGTQACKALRSLGYEIVLVNSNPATIMTDPETADKTYIKDVMKKHGGYKTKRYIYTTGFKHKFWLPYVKGVKTL